MALECGQAWGGEGHEQLPPYAASRYYHLHDQLVKAEGYGTWQAGPVQRSHGLQGGAQAPNPLRQARFAARGRRGAPYPICNDLEPLDTACEEPLGAAIVVSTGAGAAMELLLRRRKSSR